jgi:hypothetical protein
LYNGENLKSIESDPIDYLAPSRSFGLSTELEAHSAVSDTN